eukprot:SAG22_NODE_18857_length_280_cov_1.259669_1_plen_56_part_10
MAVLPLALGAPRGGPGPTMIEEDLSRYSKTELDDLIRQEEKRLRREGRKRLKREMT